MDETVMFFLAGILIVGGLLFTIITMRKGSAHQLDVDKFRSRWMSIETQLKRDEISTYHLGIINADKLVDQALIERGYGGKNMGERMKNAQAAWTSANGIWAAHKLRNKLAHETDARVSLDEARRAIINYKQALKDVGAI